MACTPQIWHVIRSTTESKHPHSELFQGNERALCRGLRTSVISLRGWQRATLHINNWNTQPGTFCLCQTTLDRQLWEIQQTHGNKKQAYICHLIESRYKIWYIFLQQTMSSVSSAGQVQPLRLLKEGTDYMHICVQRNFHKHLTWWIGHLPVGETPAQRIK